MAAGLSAQAFPRDTGDMPPQTSRIVIRVSRETRLTAVIVASAMFMQNLDSTVIATALPTMARSFGYDPVRMNVALTSYLLSLAVFIPASGWIADRFGARNVFRAAIVVFTVGSILCGQSTSSVVPGRARILQGMGGAMMVPVGRLLLLRTAAKTELVAAMAWLTMPALLGPVRRPAGRRLHRHLFRLALDLLHQHPDRHPGLRRWSPCSSRMFANRRAAPSTCSGLLLSRPGARRPDVRPGDAGPRHVRARDHRGDDRRRPGRRPSATSCTRGAVRRRCSTLR